MALGEPACHADARVQGSSHDKRAGKRHDPRGVERVKRIEEQARYHGTERRPEQLEGGDDARHGAEVLLPELAHSHDRRADRAHAGAEAERQAGEDRAPVGGGKAQEHGGGQTSCRPEQRCGAQAETVVDCAERDLADDDAEQVERPDVARPLRVVPAGHDGGASHRDGGEAGDRVRDDRAVDDAHRHEAHDEHPKRGALAHDLPAERDAHGRVRCLAL